MKKSTIIIFFLTLLFSPFFVHAVDNFATYSSTAFYHDHCSSKDWLVANEVLEKYPFQGNESVLHVGSADGRISANLAGRLVNGKIVGNEMRGKGAIQYAQANYQPLYTNLSFNGQDPASFDYENQFDLIASFSFLHWHPNQKTVVQNIYRALKKNGQFIFTVPLKTIPEMAHVIREVMNQEEWKELLSSWKHPGHKLTIDEYASLLTQCGFHLLDKQVVKRHLIFENKKEFFDWFKMHRMMESLPENKIDHFLINLVNHYSLKWMRVDGQIPFTYSQIIIQAGKS